MLMLCMIRILNFSTGKFLGSIVAQLTLNQANGILKGAIIAVSLKYLSDF